MNIDVRPLNKGALMTKYHVPTAQEIKHQLKDFTVFSEIDMNHGFHQTPLSQKTSKKLFNKEPSQIHLHIVQWCQPAPAFLWQSYPGDEE